MPTAATCLDDIKNGQETAVDCGGPQCPPCNDGKKCSKDRDCRSGMCKEDGTVKLDGVGGAIILMQASLHREGAYFPPYPFNHSIETEGLAKMTKEMGSQPYGMPMLKIWHK